MKKTMKRMFALLLVLCMLSAEIPASVFAVDNASQSTGSSTNTNQSSTDQNSGTQTQLDTPEGVKIVYNLRDPNYVAGIANGGSMQAITLDTTNNFWGCANHNGATLNWNNPNKFAQIKYNATGNGRFNALEIYVPVAGEYDLSMVYGKYRAGAEVDVIVLRNADSFKVNNAYNNSSLSSGIDAAVTAGAENEDTASAVNMGKVSGYDASRTSLGSATTGMGKVYLEAGIHLIAFRGSASFTFVGGSSFYLREIILTSGTGVAVMEMTASADKTVLMPGNKTRINASAYLSDPSVTDLTYSYTSSNQNVATVGTDGIVTAVAEGTTEITVAAVVEGKTVATRKVDITVRMPDLSGLKLIYDLNAYLTEGSNVRDVNFAATHNFWAYGADNASGSAITVDANGINAAFTAADQYVTLKLTVPAKGEYALSLTHAANTNGGKADVYVIPGNTTDIPAALTNKIGEADFSAAATDAAVGTVNIAAAGEYLIVFKTQAGTKFGVNPGVISLIDGDAVSAMDIVVAAGKTELKLSECTKLTPTAYLSDPKVTDMTFRYKALDAYTTVDADGNVTVIEADRTVVSAQIEVSVEVYGQVVGTKVVTLSIAAFMDSGVKVIYNYSGSQNAPVRVVDSFDKTNNFWHYYKDNAYADDDVAQTEFRFNPLYGIVANLGNGEWFALKLNVPAAGDYVLTQEYAARYNGTEFAVYFLTGDITDVGAALAGATPIAQVNSLSTGEIRDSFNAVVNVPEGTSECLLVVKRTGGSKDVVYLDTTTLWGGEGLAPMKLVPTIEKSTIKVTERLQISAKTYLSDGSAAEVSYTYNALTPHLATVDATGVVTGVSEGAAKFEVSVNISGVQMTEEVELSILPLSASGVKVIYKWSRYLDYKDPVRPITYEDTHGFWAYHSDTAYASVSNADERIIIHPTYGIRSYNGRVGEWIALKIKVPEKGDYNMTQTYFAQEKGANFKVYILPGDTADIPAALAQTKEVGVISDGYAVETTEKTVDFGIVNFAEAGEYVLVIQIISGGKGSYIYFGDTTLTGGDETRIMDVSASVWKDQIKQTDRLSIEAAAYYSDGSSSANGITYATSDKNVATVGTDGVVNGINPGTAAITVSAGAYSKVLNITVEKFNASGVKLDYNLKQYSKYKDPVRLIGYEKTHGFWSYYADNIYADDETRDAKLFIHTNYGIQAQAVGVGKWLAIKINVPKAGDYSLTMGHNMHNNGALAAVYILPGTTAVEDIQGLVTSENAVREIGTVDFYGKPTQVGETNLGAVTFETAGEYLVVYKNLGKGGNNEGGSYMHPGTLHFYGGEDTVIMNLETVTEKTTLKTGATEQITATTYLSDGSIANCVYQYASLNDSAVVNRSGLITAVKKGEAQIKVTAVMPTGSVDKTVVLSVVDTMPSGSQVLYDMLYGFSYKQNVREIEYNDTVGKNWEYYADGDTKLARDLSIHTSYGIRFSNNQKGHWLALKIKVPAAGDYMMTQTHGKYYDGCLASVYILPGDTAAEDIPEAILTTPRLSGISFYNPSLVVVDTKLGIVNFPEAGEYIVVYKPDSVPEGGRTYHLCVGDIYLDGLNCLKTVTPVEENISLTYGQTYQSEFVLRRLDGSVVDPADCVITFRSADSQIATVDDRGVVTAVGHGTTTIEITAYDGVESHTGAFTVTAIDNTGVKDAYIDLDTDLYVRETALVNLTLVMNSGNKVKLTGSEIDITVSDSNLLSVENGTVTAKAEGTATIKVAGYFLGEIKSAELTVTIVAHPGKTEPTYYTYEMRNNALINVVKYEEVRSTRDLYVRQARFYLRSYEVYYDLIPYEGIPRSRQVGYEPDTKYGYCRYCGANVVGIYGASGVGGWNIDPVKHPWKVQCKDCLRWFPSNDFGSFYELGLDEHGVFDYNKAWAENEKLIASGHEGYLVNKLYPEKGEGWGVDDGWGYRVYTDGTAYHKLQTKNADGSPKAIVTDNMDHEQCAAYIPLFMYIFLERYEAVIGTFSDAYAYTGEIEYARAGAMMLDRLADVLPGYDVNANYINADWKITCGGSGYGIFGGRINDAGIFATVGPAADSFFPALNDPLLIKKLSQKAEELGLENDKSTSQKIWQNWRDNLLLECLEAAESGRIAGNYGQTHQGVAKCAIALAEEPETANMLAWIYKSDTLNHNRKINGGDLDMYLINTLDRDGISNEGSNNYNSFQAKQLFRMADAMALYTGEGGYNPYEHPKFAQMFVGFPAMILSDSHIAQFGDAGSVASLEFAIDNALYISAFKNLKDTPYGKRIAQTLYIMNGGDLSNLSYGGFSADPMQIRYEIMSYVDIHEDKFSEMLTGQGYSVLRDGFLGDPESQQSAWMYFGGCGTSHGHYDVLGMGIEAFGLNIAPELGYPSNTGEDHARGHWVSASISHNLVVVDGKNQDRISAATTPLLFDDSEYVQVMSADGLKAYPQVDEYYRTMVQVKIDDDDSYYLDFFRVLGGTQHTYSFHAQSHGAMPMSGLDLELQTDENGNLVGTYAGPDVEFGTSGDFPRGYGYMTKVRKDTDPEDNKFVVDFTITDYRGAVANNKDIHLKMTQINNFTPDEVAIVGGYVPVKQDNAPITEETDTLEYVLTQRGSENGEELDSLFTTVFEPYKRTSNIRSIEQLPVKAVAGKPGQTDVAVALLVTHASGRIDYVFYSNNNTVTYRVDDTFDVRGYVGVYSLDGNKGVEIYRYVTGGDIIVEETGETSVYTGTVQGFSTELSMYDNYIDVNLDGSVADKLAGRYIFVENDGVENGVYKIESAKAIDGGVRLNLGTVTLIRSLRDSDNVDAGYIYNIAKGQRFHINMAYTKCDLATNTHLMFLELNGSQLTPDLDPDVYDYTTFVDPNTRTIDIRAFAADPNATIKIQSGATVYNDSVAEEVPIAVGKNKLKVTVIAEDGMTSRTYWITATRADHFCYGGTAYCDEEAICVECGSHYGYIDPDNHKTVELWNGKYATKESDGYSGDYYCVVCKLLATKGHVLVYQPPVNIGLILLIAAGVLLVGGGATVATILVLKKRKKNAVSGNAETGENLPKVLAIYLLLLYYNISFPFLHLSENFLSVYCR